MNLTVPEKQLLELLVYQKELERVTDKFELWRKPAPLKGACGGRGAGAKSRSVSSLLVQKLEYSRKRWFCGREIQKSLEESSYALILDQIKRLGYKDWEGVKSSSKIINRKNGSYFYFGGIRDEKKAKGLKGLEDFDGCWIDEGEDIPMDVWDILIPTFRKDDSEIWITFNRNKDIDPAYRLLFIEAPEDTISIELLPGKLDNEWFPEKLQKRLDHDYLVRPDIAEHIWGGKPKKQGFKSVMSRTAVRAAMNRNIVAVGGKACGVDVARFGDDDSEIYLRQGMKIVDHKTLHGVDTQELATIVWDMVDKDPSVPIVIDDTGVGGGVSDRLKVLGAKVIMINFAMSADDEDKYKGVISEMWFEFPVNEADIPDDDELMDQLTEREYDYDKNEVKLVETKKKFKERYGRSPDKSDALLLCYYTKKRHSLDSDIAAALNKRNGR